MTEPCNDEGCVHRIHQLERSLCELKEQLRVQKEEYDERLRVQKEEYEEQLGVQKEKEEHDTLLLAQQDATIRAYYPGYYPLPLDHFPLEIIALIADFVHDTDGNFSNLCAMMLVSRSLRDSVSLCKSWRVVNEVVTHVGDVGERRKILLSRSESVQYACTHSARLLSYLPLSRYEAVLCLTITCNDGQLECVRYLVETFDIEADDIRAYNNNICLQAACLYGHIHVVQYLHTALALTTDDARNQSLRIACQDGHLPVVQYLRVSFGLTADDARAYNNGTLLSACANGHLPVVQYLRESFGLTANDARDGSRALRLACQDGHLHVVQYLHTAFGLTVDDARYNVNEALLFACKLGHLPVIQYLHTAFGLTAEDAQSRDNEGRLMASANGYLPVVQYLHTAFGVMEGDPFANQSLLRSIRAAESRGYDDVVEYLTSQSV